MQSYMVKYKVSLSAYESINFFFFCQMLKSFPLFTYLLNCVLSQSQKDFHHSNPPVRYCKASLKLQSGMCKGFADGTRRKCLTVAAQTAAPCPTRPRSLGFQWTVPVNTANSSKQLVAVENVDSLKYKHKFTHILPCPLMQVMLLQLKTMHFPRRSKKPHLIHLLRIVHQYNISGATVW